MISDIRVRYKRKLLYTESVLICVPLFCKESAINELLFVTVLLFVNCKYAGDIIPLIICCFSGENNPWG